MTAAVERAAAPPAIDESSPPTMAVADVIIAGGELVRGAKAELTTDPTAAVALAITEATTLGTTNGGT